MSIKELQEYTRISKYARYNKEEKRRETWDEQINRVMDMHKEKYKNELNNIKEELDLVEYAMKKKLILGSQRALQFGGRSILEHNAKIYNCTVSYADRPRFFQETMYLLLCGCGVGFSVQTHHIKKLPNISKPSDEKIKVYIEDSIEGWADAIGKLMSSYFTDNTPFDNCKNKTISFDYSKIRPKGALISSSGGKAPGPDGLRKSIDKIKNLLDICVEKGRLDSIDVYDIIMHISDAVLSGGIRRSATICIFSKEDDKMMKAKTGDWFVKNPQRGRSNNSVLLLRDDTSKKEFDEIIKSVKEFGEPGFLFADDKEALFNPCQPKWASVLTRKGIETFENVNVGDEIWSKDGWTKIVKKWSTGIKDVYRYRTNSGVFYGTENHRVLSNGEKIEVKDASSIDVLIGSNTYKPELNGQDIIDGLVMGDGTYHKASNRVLLCIGEKDKDYFDSEVKDYILENYYGTGYKTKTIIDKEEVCKTFDRRIPKRFFSNKDSLCGFLRGLYSANGCIIESAKRISFKTTSKYLVEDIQIALSSFGIRSYFTTNKKTETVFKNGTYTCKESYDINITSDKNIFLEKIGFIQKYKSELLSKICEEAKQGTTKNTFDIISKELVSTEEVFDITVGNESHTYWTGGCNVSNCVEIGMYAYDEFGNSGWSFCNLCEINVKKAKTKEEFYDMCKYASILGTLQAGYHSFPYLGEVTERIVKREALLGVSMTGMMDNPDISFDPDIQKDGAKTIRKINEEMAKKININPGARVSCIKPSGSSSCILGTASGIHPHHAKRYFRRVQANKLEEPLKYFRQINPLAVEESVWSTNQTDDVITFLCEVPPKARTKVDVSGLDLLKNVKLTQQNWIHYGKNKELCTKDWLSHNVSNTIHVKDDEWDEVTNYIYSNRKYFAGISLLPIDGDKDYCQAPFTTVYTPEEIVKDYGDGSLMASGLIVDGLRFWDGDLWSACNCVLGIGEDLNLPQFNSIKKELKWKRENNIDDKTDWVRRAIQFAERYFSGDNRKMTYCLKDVHNWKLWCDLKREYKNVDWENFHEMQDNTKISETIACAGGKCDLF